MLSGETVVFYIMLQHHIVIVQITQKLYCEVECSMAHIALEN